MEFKKVTEQSSNYQDLDKMSTIELIENINKEDQTVAFAVEKEKLKIEKLVNAIVKKMRGGGRLFYMGAGTSGRLGVVDASECPPTFGVDHGLVVGLIAGGDKAIRKAVEFAEDSVNQGWEDLKAYNISTNDVVIGIAASGTTPYVIGAMEACKSNNILTGSITCNPNSPIDLLADFPVCPEVGPEFVTGSTRMKSGTAQKMVLNMISTTVMIKLGKVKGNKMVDMQLSNDKLVDRGTKMVAQGADVDYKTAKTLLIKYGSVRKAIDFYKKSLG
ncbi:MAG: N-acetylmuramic acid 6-phosphate etherase [Flavobacteriales bacterium]|jgi:N-acetylmuramic acid 6-phosphate etherase|nr:N-acetylmuramic acid 6-phosphate etherase [Flavobacteriales bacterium]